MKDNTKLRSNLLLLLSAFFWGIAFVAQESGAKLIPAFTFNAVRMTIGGVVLLPVIYLMGRKQGKDENNQKSGKATAKQLLLGGVLCGGALFIASALQQQGLSYTSASKSGFITALYIVLVPIIGLFLKKKVNPLVWAAVVLSCIGMYMLCVTEGFTQINKGDLITMLCALFFSIQILLVDYFVKILDPVKLSCVQFFTVGIISAVPAVLLEQTPIANILSAWGALLYTGVFSCGIAYTCQVIGQKGAKPAVASLIMSLESVFAALSGSILLPETNSLTPHQIIGCILMFSAILLSQLPVKSPKNG